MPIIFGLLGLFVGAGFASSFHLELVGAVIGCIAGVWFGRWLKKTKPKPQDVAQAAVRPEEPSFQQMGAKVDRESLDERVRALALRVSHLESEIVRLGGSVATVAAEPVLRAEPAAAIATQPLVEDRPVAPESNATVM